MIRRALLTLMTLPVLLASAPRVEAAGSGTPAAPQTPVAALGVDRLMKEPEKHPGALVVEGVVKTVSKKNQSLALIDVDEYRKCGVVTCALLALPVRWTGEMPAVLDVVRVEGEITAEKGKMLFSARKLERVPEKTQP